MIILMKVKTKRRLTVSRMKKMVSIVNHHDKDNENFYDNYDIKVIQMRY